LFAKEASIFMQLSVFQLSEVLILNLNAKKSGVKTVKFSDLAVLKI